MADGAGVGIIGLGAALPEGIRSNADWPPGWAKAAWSRESDLIRTAERQIGLSADEVVREEAGIWASDPFRGAVERRVLAQERDGSSLEIEAAREALASAGSQPADIDLLMTHSDVPDDAGLGNHGILARDLELPRRLLSFTLEAGCGSFGPQVVAAQALLAGGCRRALLVQSSLASRVIDYRDPTSANVGDGATAQVLGHVEPGLGVVGWEQLTRGDLRDGLVLARAGGGRWYEAGPVPAPFTVQVRDPVTAARMGAGAAEFCREVSEPLLARASVRPEEIALLVTPHATVWFARACARLLGIDPERTVPVATQFQRFGHLSSASAPLGLWLAWHGGQLRKGDLVLVYTPGAGFTQTAVLHRWAMDPPPPGSVRAL